MPFDQDGVIGIGESQHLQISPAAAVGTARGGLQVPRLVAPQSSPRVGKGLRRLKTRIDRHRGQQRFLRPGRHDMDTEVEVQLLEQPQGGSGEVFLETTVGPLGGGGDTGLGKFLEAQSSAFAGLVVVLAFLRLLGVLLCLGDKPLREGVVREAIEIAMGHEPEIDIPHDHPAFVEKMLVETHDLRGDDRLSEIASAGLLIPEEFPDTRVPLFHRRAVGEARRGDARPLGVSVERRNRMQTLRAKRGIDRIHPQVFGVLGE